jgi:hypothetical protein
MNEEEKAILDYLKTQPHSFVSGREIAKRVGGKRRYEEDRTWAVPILAAMVQAGILEKDQMGHFRIIPEDVKKKKKTRAYVSPHILKILKSSGRNFESIDLGEEDNAEAAPTGEKPKETDAPKPDAGKPTK